VTIGLASSDFMLTWERLLIVEANFDKTKNRIARRSPRFAEGFAGQAQIDEEKEILHRENKGFVTETRLSRHPVRRSLGEDGSSLATADGLGEQGKKNSDGIVGQVGREEVANGKMHERLH